MSCPEKYFSFDKGITHNVKGSNAKESDLRMPTTLRMPVCLYAATVLLAWHHGDARFPDPGCRLSHGIRRGEETRLEEMDRKALTWQETDLTPGIKSTQVGLSMTHIYSLWEKILKASGSVLWSQAAVTSLTCKYLWLFPVSWSGRTYLPVTVVSAVTSVGRHWTTRSENQPSRSSHSPTSYCKIFHTVLLQKESLGLTLRSCRA